MQRLHVLEPRSSRTRLSITLYRRHRADSHSMLKILIIACLIAIVISLGSGLFHLVNDKGDSKRMVRALTIRVALSVALFILLLIAWSQGMIQPHGLGR
jgi:succinate dehydrogenase/fumarate reductase cytochrome b subunit